MNLLDTMQAVKALVPEGWDVDYVAHRREEDANSGVWSIMCSLVGEWAEGKYPVAADLDGIEIIAKACIMEVERPGIDFTDPVTLENAQERIVEIELLDDPSPQTT